MRFKNDADEIICLCGSRKFVDIYLTEYKRLEQQGNTVLSVGISNQDVDGLTDEQKSVQENIHQKKIDMADRIHILDGKGEISKFTKNNIAYAKENDIPITWYSKNESEKEDGVYYGSYPQLFKIIDKNGNFYSFELSSLRASIKTKNLEDGKCICYSRLEEDSKLKDDMLYMVMKGHNIHSIEHHNIKAKRISNKIDGRVISYGRLNRTNKDLT